MPSNVTDEFNNTENSNITIGPNNTNTDLNNTNTDPNNTNITD